MPNIGGKKKKKTSYDVFLDFVDVDEKDPTRVIVDRVFSLECFHTWVNSRARTPKKPTESFRRALTAHVRGTDMRKPFPPLVEKQLLRKLRECDPWVHFDNIGGYGFRGKGYWETEYKAFLGEVEDADKRKSSVGLEGVNYADKSRGEGEARGEDRHWKGSTGSRSKVLAYAADLIINEPLGRSMKRKASFDGDYCARQTLTKREDTNVYVRPLDEQHLKSEAEDVLSLPSTTAAPLDSLTLRESGISQIVGSSEEEDEGIVIFELPESCDDDVAQSMNDTSKSGVLVGASSYNRAPGMLNGRKRPQVNRIDELNRLAAEAKDLDEECRKLFYFMKTASKSHSTISSRYACAHKEALSDEELKEFIKSVHKNSGYFSPPACFLLDKLLRSQPRDMRLCTSFFCVEANDRMFNPHKPVGRMVLDKSTRKIVDSDRGARECVRGDPRGMSSYDFWTSKLEAMARVPVWAIAMREGRAFWMRKRLYRLDGSIGVFLFRYTYSINTVTNKRSVITHMQDVTERFHLIQSQD